MYMYSTLIGPLCVNVCVNVCVCVRVKYMVHLTIFTTLCFSYSLSLDNHSIAVCTLRDDPYPVESLLSPWLAHQLVSVYEGDTTTAALFHRSAIDKQHRTCTLTFHSALSECIYM